MKIVFLDWETVSEGKVSLEEFKSLGEVVVYDNTSREDVVKNIGDADVVMVNKAGLTKEEIALCPNLKYVGLFSTGYNHIPCDEAREKGISVCNTPGYSTYAVAQYAISLLLEICGQVGYYNKRIRQGAWAEKQSFYLNERSIMELFGKTIGIIGYGQIGKQTATIAKALGMNVLAYNRGKIFDDPIATLCSFDYLLENADVISLHCPLNEQTHEILNEQALVKAKDGVIVINTSRGALIEERALLTALNSGKIAYAGLDVFGVEPIGKDSPYMQIENAYYSPHLAWAPVETRQRVVKMAFDNLKAYVDGNPTNVVN